MEIQAGPSNGILPKGNKWIRANHLVSYYGDGKHNVSRYRELVREACRGIDTKIDFRQYDRDRNGIVDHLFVIHSGDDEASTFTWAFGPNIWSVLVPSVNGKFDGVTVDAAVLVPMVAGMRSLNVAVAGAMVLGEALRQIGGFAEISP